MRTETHLAFSPGATSATTHTVTRTWISSQRLVASLIVVAVLMRVLGALYQGNTVAELPGIYDQISYHGLAMRVADGYGFSFAEGHWPATRAGEPTAHWSYLYTLYLAGIYALFGVQPLLARLVQAVLVGWLHTWLAYRLGRRVFGPVAGVFTAAISAVYLYFVYYAGGLLTESFYLVGILWTLDVSFRLADTGGGRPRAWHWLELGLAIGVTVLLRQVFMIFVPFLFAWLWWTVSVGVSNTERAGIANQLRLATLPGLFAAGLVVVAMIAPFTVRNYRAFGTFVPLNTNAGFAFFWGNHPIHGTRFMPLLPADGPSYADLIPPQLLALNEGDLDRALLREALSIVAADPGRLVRLSLSRMPEYFKFWPSTHSGMVSNMVRVASFGLALPFMLYGLWLSFGMMRSPAHEGQRAQLVLLYAFTLAYAGVHLLTWTLIRYRLPVDAVLLLFAGAAVTSLVARSPCHVDTTPRSGPHGGEMP